MAFYGSSAGVERSETPTLAQHLLNINKVWDLCRREWACYVYLVLMWSTDRRKIHIFSKNLLTSNALGKWSGLRCNSQVWTCIFEKEGFWPVLGGLRNEAIDFVKSCISDQSPAHSYLYCLFWIGIAFKSKTWYSNFILLWALTLLCWGLSIH